MVGSWVCASRILPWPHALGPSTTLAAFVLWPLSPPPVDQGIVSPSSSFRPEGVTRPQPGGEQVKEPARADSHERLKMDGALGGFEANTDRVGMKFSGLTFLVWFDEYHPFDSCGDDVFRAVVARKCRAEQLSVACADVVSRTTQQSFHLSVNYSPVTRLDLESAYSPKLRAVETAQYGALQYPE